jgi:hypothetical protein
VDPEVQRAQDRYEDSGPGEQIRHDDECDAYDDRRVQLTEEQIYLLLPFRYYQRHWIAVVLYAIQYQIYLQVI